MYLHRTPERFAAPLAALLAACAGPSGLKGGALVPFAAEGITDAAVQRHAILIGIDHFEDARFGSLRFAGADARSLGAALSEFDDVRLLTRPEETRRAAILEALAELEKRILGPRDTVVIYFSTHGSLARRPGGELERHLAVADTRLDLIRETGLSIDELVRRAERLPARRVALILATCHGGKGKSQIPDALARALAGRKAAPPRLEDVSEAVVVLTAAAFGEAAREDESLGHDVYTHFLLEALERGDRDGDGAVTISEAHDYARERTYLFTEGSQRPAAESTILGLDPIVLRGRRQRAGRPVIYSYAPSSEGITVRVGGVAKGVLPGGFAVSEGEQRLELAEAGSGRSLFAGALWLRSGERVELSRLIPPPPSLELELGVGLFAPLSRGARATLPTAPMVTLRSRLGNWLYSGFALELGLSLAGNGGQAATFDQPLRFQMLAWHLQLGARRSFALGRGLTLAPIFQVGSLWLSRRFSTPPYSADESLRATTLSPGLDLEVSPTEALRVGLRLEVPLFAAELAGPRHVHAALQAAGRVGWVF
jgi:hypothetical protein